MCLGRIKKNIVCMHPTMTRTEIVEGERTKRMLLQAIRDPREARLKIGLGLRRVELSRR